jgi:O-antigen/teichoic acid export membrane protein
VKESAGRFVRDVFLTLGTRWCLYGFALLGSVILTRLLGPEGRGAYVLANLVPGLAVVLGSLGLQISAVYLTAQKRHPLHLVVGNILMLTALLSAASVLVSVVVLLLYRERLFPGIGGLSLFLALALIPFSVLLSNVLGVLGGLERFKDYNLVLLAQAAAQLALVGLLTWGAGLGVAGAILAQILAAVVACGVALWWLAQHGGAPSFQPVPDFLKEALRYGLVTHIGSVLVFLNHRVDVFIVSALLSTAAVGFYSLSVGLAEILWSLSFAAGTVLFPRVTTAMAEEPRNQLTRSVARFVFLVTAAAATLLFLASPLLVVALYSQQFLPSIRPLQILLPGVVALAVARVLANDLAGRGKNWVNNLVALATASTNIALNLLLLPRLGIEGAAWASTAAYTMALIAQVVVYTRYSGDIWTRLFVPERGDFPLYWKAARGLARSVAHTANELAHRDYLS